MDSIREYGLTVISISIVCSAVLMFFKDSPYEATVKLLTGLMVTVTVVNPLLRDTDLSIDRFWDEIIIEKESAVIDGTLVAKEAEASYIRSAMETYIFNEAEEMGTQISAQIQLSDDDKQTPDKVILNGEVAPYIKSRLSEMIYSDLGIAEERQIWISRN